MVLISDDKLLSSLQNYNAKLSDFGLAKDGPIGDESHVSTRVMGTYGYAAPEYLATGIHTTQNISTVKYCNCLYLQHHKNYFS